MTSIPNHQQTAPIAADAADGLPSSLGGRRRLSAAIRARRPDLAKHGAGGVGTRSAGFAYRWMQETRANLATVVWTGNFGASAFGCCVLAAISGGAPQLAWFYAGMMTTCGAASIIAIASRAYLIRRWDSVLARALEAALAEGADVTLSEAA